MEARGREAMFIDNLNGHYMRMCGAMSRSYLQWRGSSRSETILEREANNNKVLNYFLIPIVIASVALLAFTGNNSGVIYAAGALGGIAVAELAKNAQQYAVEADLHRATVEELEISFEGEIKPMVVELQGVTRKLTGSIDEQYEEWRRLLEEIYEAEMGMISEASAPLAPRSAATLGIPNTTEEASSWAMVDNSLVVKLAGGASIIDTNNTFNIGKRNVLAVRKFLWQYGLGAVAENVGGNISRSVSIEVSTGRVTVSSPGRGEWKL